jgi:DNA polymerase (family 10)
MSEHTNADVASIFLQLADYLEIAGENPFKTRAYRNAAQTLNDLPEPIATVAAEGRLDDLPGFGPAIVAKTRDILSTGTTKAYAAMQAQIPAGVLEFLKLPGIGVKTVNQLWEGLKVADVDALEAAAKAHRVRELKGMSKKTEAKILDAIGRYRRYRGSLLLDDADSLAERFRAPLAAVPGVGRVVVAGDLRRGTETVASIDLLCETADPATVLSAVEAIPQAIKVRSRTEHTACAETVSGTPVMITAVSPSAFAVQQLRLTGSSSHVSELEAFAAQHGCEFGTNHFAKSGIAIAATDEDDIYRAVGLPAILPQLREGRGEIGMAVAGTLPHVIAVSDIKGNLHQHTTASDGHNTLAEMVEACRERGYEYCAITDHSKALAMTNGLTPERVREQIAQVREAEQTAGIRIFAGSEVDILADGTMDFDDELLSELDIVIASVHSRFALSREEQTARVVRAIQNPHVDLIAHPTGRLLLAREPYEIDMDQVISAAAATGTALEINAFPDRLDLNENYARGAAAAGVMITINTDAHKTWHLDFMKYGVNIAQRAGLTAHNVLNARTAQEVTDWLRR